MMSHNLCWCASDSSGFITPEGKHPGGCHSMLLSSCPPAGVTSGSGSLDATCLVNLLETLPKGGGGVEFLHLPKLSSELCFWHQTSLFSPSSLVGIL